MKLSERLEALLALAECTDDAERDHNAPDAECVFVDVRPAVFDALLRDAAELARSVEGAAHGRVVVPYGDGPDFALANDETMEFANVRHLRNQRVRLVPEAGQEVGK